MHTMTATEAGRSFAAAPDAAERGQTVVVTRGGRRVAVIGPAPVGNGAGGLALLGDLGVDEDLADDLRGAREAVSPQGPAWPDD